ncbi:MAG TPA: energy transducer TonB [Thermoanaerobaculia bacterium]|jgi:TonB family protein|nr:energy transducer TonB [Thermoanaerobaculia bacterium]
MIRSIAAVLCLAAVAPVSSAQESDIAKGLKNLAEMHRIASAIELRRTLAGTTQMRLPPDPWGTPYDVQETTSGYRIVSAGSDLKFDEMVALTSEQFDGLEGDIVLEDGRLVRSNRNWLYSRIAGNADASPALEQLRQAEIDHAVMRIPAMKMLTGVKATAMAMQMVASYIDQNKTAPPPELSRDAWGTPLRIDLNPDGTYRIVSASADRKFDEESWTRPPAPNTGEDIIFENGKVTRQVNEAEVMRTGTIRAAAIPQPPDPSLEGGRWLRVREGITAPVPVQRVEPVYPDEYRRAHVTGIVVLEVAISESGTIEDVSILKSLAPGLDMAAADAVRKWTFKPAMQDGKPVPVLFNLTINFKLK